MPLTKKGRTIMQAMRNRHGERAEEVFYRSRNAGRISGVDRSMASYARNRGRARA